MFTTDEIDCDEVQWNQHCTKNEVFDNPEECADLVTFTEDILIGKLHFWYSAGMGLSIWYVRKIFRKTNISIPLIHTHTCPYWEVRNDSFPENFVYVLNRWSQCKFLLLVHYQNDQPINQTVKTAPYAGQNLERVRHWFRTSRFISVIWL